MSSTYSPLLRIELIGTGDQPGTWGDTTNTNLGSLIEQAIAGTATFSVTAGNVTLSALNGSSDQSRCMALLVTGTPSATRNIIAPASSKIYVVSNTSDSSVVLKTSVSTGLTIPSGVTQFAYYNGTDFIAASQPYDADLKALADLATTGIIVRTGSGTAATRSIAVSGTGLSVSNADGVSGNPTVTSNATSSNTVSTLVARDSSGNFSAGTITATLTGNVTGNVTGNLTGNVTGDVSGNAGTVTNGVYTTGTYSNPSWITALAASKLTGQVAVANGGTGAATLTGVVYGNGTSAMTAATGSQIASAIGASTVTNATNATNVVTGGTIASDVTATTQSAGTNNTTVATTAFIAAAIAAALPSGVITMWSGSVASIPSGWYLCNGANGTPDLRNKFIVGAGSTYAVAATGGSADAIVVSHTHTATSSVTDPGHTHNVVGGGGGGSSASLLDAAQRNYATTSATTGITVSTTVNSTGSSGTNANLPPYYALAYIMKA